MPAAEQTQALGELGIVREGHAALAGRDDLDWMEAEHRDVAIGAGSDTLAF